MLFRFIVLQGVILLVSTFSNVPVQGVPTVVVEACPVILRVDARPRPLAAVGTTAYASRPPDHVVPAGPKETPVVAVRPAHGAGRVPRRAFDNLEIRVLGQTVPVVGGAPVGRRAAVVGATTPTDVFHVALVGVAPAVAGRRRPGTGVAGVAEVARPAPETRPLGDAPRLGTVVAPVVREETAVAPRPRVRPDVVPVVLVVRPGVPRPPPVARPFPFPSVPPAEAGTLGAHGPEVGRLRGADVGTPATPS